MKHQYSGCRPARSAFASYRVGGQSAGRSATGGGASNQVCAAITPRTQSW